MYGKVNIILTFFWKLQFLIETNNDPLKFMSVHSLMKKKWLNFCVYNKSNLMIRFSPEAHGCVNSILELCVKCKGILFDKISDQFVVIESINEPKKTATIASQ